MKNLQFSKRYGLLILCLWAAPMFLSAQGLTGNTSAAQEMANLLNTKEVTYGQASRFALDAANVFSALNDEEAFNFAVQQNWLKGNVNHSDPARLDKIAFLLMGSFEKRGGLMYSIFKSPRYAYRELMYLNVIQKRASPSMYVSGDQFLFYVNRLLGLREIEQARRSAQYEARRQALVAEITGVIEEQAITDTTVEETAQGVLITFSNIMFQADSAELPDAERAKIYEIAPILGSIPNIRLYIAGHSTDVGTRQYLLELSRARAQSVADYLVSLGAVRTGNVRIIGYGADRPIADNATPAGMAANRRVEIIILEN